MYIKIFFRHYFVGMSIVERFVSVWNLVLCVLPLHMCIRDGSSYLYKTIFFSSTIERSKKNRNEMKTNSIQQHLLLPSHIKRAMRACTNWLLRNGYRHSSNTHTLYAYVKHRSIIVSSSCFVFFCFSFNFLWSVDTDNIV